MSTPPFVAGHCPVCGVSDDLGADACGFAGDGCPAGEVQKRTLEKVLELLDGNQLQSSTARALEPVAAFAMAKQALARQLRQEIGVEAVAALVERHLQGKT